MAVGFISTNVTLAPVSDLTRIKNATEVLINETPALLLVIEQMRDGDGSQAAHYTYATSKFGCDSDAKMKELYDELASFNAKFSGNGSVSNVNASFRQLLAKLG